MSQEQYDLVFSGQLVPGFDLAQVKQNMAALFRIDETKVQVLFSGKPITLKKSLALEVATKYRVAMKKAGARADLVLCKEEVQKSQPEKAANSSASSGTHSSEKEAGGFQTSLGAQPVTPSTPRVKIETPDFGVAAMGGHLLNPEERSVVKAVVVDTSQLSVAPQSGNLVDESELAHPEILDITIPDLDIAPPGSDLIKADERKKVIPVNVDISSLSVAQVGGKLSPEAPKPPPAPDVSHISLE